MSVAQHVEHPGRQTTACAFGSTLPMHITGANLTYHACNLLQPLQPQVAELQAALEDERTEKGKLKSALEEVMRHKSALHLPLLQQGSGAADTGPSAAPSVRDTARSACSGYDDHPTHRSSSALRARVLICSPLLSSPLLSPFRGHAKDCQRERRERIARANARCWRSRSCAMHLPSSLLSSHDLPPPSPFLHPS